MKYSIYSFVGATTALQSNLGVSGSSEEAVAAAVELQKVSEQLMAGVVGDSTEETFKSQLDEHVVTVLESLEVIRAAAEYPKIDQELRALLEGFYDLADALMGGGGCDLDHGHGAACYTDFTA
jgi:hypothetical protein